MELYILKSTITFSVLYAFYWLFLRKETYHSWNRMFLMTSIFVSFIFPFLSYPLQEISINNFSTVLSPVIINGKYNPVTIVSTTEKLDILSIIYLSGALFFTLRFISSLAKIQFLYFRFPRANYRGFKAVLLDSDQSPFTFFNLLFISRKDYENGKIEEMIVHESAHRDNYHSLDIVLLEIITILQWFNPFTWLYRRSLKSEHEYIADQTVLKKGFDVISYQKMLFEKSLGITSFELTNSFNYSLLKKRLKMMTIHKTNLWIRLKYILSIPALLAIILLLAVNISSSAQKEDKKVSTEVDVQATYQNGGIEGLREFVKKNIVYPKSAIDKKYSAKVYVQFIVDRNGKVLNPEVLRSDITNSNGKVLKYEKKYIEQTQTGKTDIIYVTDPEIDLTALKDLNEEAVKVVNKLPDFTPAQKDGKNVSTEFTLPIQFQL